MRSSTFLKLVLILVIFAGIWILFTLFPIIPVKSKQIISVESECKLGDKLVKEILKDDKNFKPIHKPYTDSCLRVIKDRLLTALGHTEYNYTFLLIENKEVNAYTLPGGYIVIYSGLIEMTDSPEELAAVIGHEMGHVEKRHIISRLMKNLGISVLLSGDTFVLGEIGKTAASTVFDRKQEKEADQFSLKLLDKAHIEPRMLAVFFRKINEDHDAFTNNAEFLMSHPDLDSRIRMALEYKPEDNFKKEAFQLDWEKCKEEIKGE